MKRRVIIGAVVAGILCGGWFLWQRTWEPAYHGHTLSEWLDASMYRDVAWWPGEVATEEAIRAMGAKAVPFLMKELQRPKPLPKPFATIVSGLSRRFHIKDKSRRFDPAYSQEWISAVTGVFRALQPREEEVVPLLIDFDRKNPESHHALLALGWVRGQRAVPYLIGQLDSTSTNRRGLALLSLEDIHPPARVMVPILIKLLKDADLTIRETAASTLKDYGEDAKDALPALRQFSSEQDGALKRSPRRRDRRSAKLAAEAAIAEIESKLRSPDGQTPSEKAQREPGRELATSLAYRHAALAAMLAEANHCAETLHLKTALPMEQRHLRKVFVGPPRLMQFLGCIDTDDYSFGFGESGRLRYITKLHAFEDRPLVEIQRRLAKVTSDMTTNSAYRLATNCLALLSVDLAELEALFPPVVCQHYYYEDEKPVAPIPIFDVMWGTDVIPSVVVTLYGPTSEILQLRQNDESFSRKPKRSSDNVERLLAIPDAEFLRYSDQQRAALATP